jgi:hypothetical protein
MVVLGNVSLGALCGACRKALVEPYTAIMREIANADPATVEAAFREHPKVRRVTELLGHEPSPWELVEGLSRLGA